MGCHWYDRINLAVPAHLPEVQQGLEHNSPMATVKKISSKNYL